MRNISKMLRELALVTDYGFTADQSASVARSRGLPDWAKTQLGEAGLARIQALTEVAYLADYGDGDREAIFRESQFVRYLDRAVRRWFTEAYSEPSEQEARMQRMMKEAMTTHQFAQYFADAIDRRFYGQYEYQTGGWAQYVYADTVSDFRNVSRFRMTEPGDLLERGEKESRVDTFIDDSVVQYGVNEFARTFDISWRAVLNDDLGKIRETPQNMARAARRSLDSFVSNLYDNATSQAALVALGALYSGTGALTVANLAVGVNAMKQRTDLNGNRIAINQVHLVIPAVLEIQAAQILSDLLAYGGANSNVMSRFIAGVHTDPYIGFSGSDVPWYLFADPMNIPAVTLARLTGWPGPVVMMKESDVRLMSGSVPAAFLLGNFDTGNIVYAVNDVYGGWEDATYAGVTDYRGVYYSSGTTA